MDKQFQEKFEVLNKNAFVILFWKVYRTLDWCYFAYQTKYCLSSAIVRLLTHWLVPVLNFNVIFGSKNIKCSERFSFDLIWPSSKKKMHWLSKQNHESISTLLVYFWIWNLFFLRFLSNGIYFGYLFGKAIATVSEDQFWVWFRTHYP